MPKLLSHEDYTVGWICPLEVEKIAALEMLDEEHGRLEQGPADNNVYNLGSIAGHNVVIAGLHHPGNSPAATVVTQMKMTFPNLRFGLLVGIGGGVPVTTDNGPICLGHVIVSKPVGTHSGAIQYDHGKARDGHFERTGYLAPPPAVLLNSALDLATKRARSRIDPVQENLERINTDLRGLRRYRYPGRSRDFLYKPDYLHRDSRVSCEEGGCNPFERIQRTAQDIDDQPYIVVHRGTIAAGEMVVKDALLRDQLANADNLLCFEMEAAGALCDFPCLVIRGISDYCDSHKNDEWHGYAAAVAAAYARQLFFHMPVVAIKRTISEAAESEIHIMNLRQDDQDREKIQHWLTRLDYGPQQSYFIKKRQAGTGQWFLDSAAFQLWLKTDKKTLFCHGVPGAGKTVITSIVIDHLQTKFLRETSTDIVYLYCNHSRHSEQTLEHFLASLLKQLVQRQPVLPQSLKELYDRHKRNSTSPSHEDLFQTLESVIKTYSRVFIVIDALDECASLNDCRESLLKYVLNLQEKYNISIFVTSRKFERLQQIFSGALLQEIYAVDDDIATYLHGRMRFQLEDPFDDLIRAQTVSSIIQAADGMFLLAELHMNTIISQPTKGDIKKALQSLSHGADGLDETYNAAMQRIQSQHGGYRSLAEQTLAWIVHAIRPLSIIELRHALAIRPHTSVLDEEYLPTATSIRSICAGLVVVDENDGTVGLVHYTTANYFQRMKQYWFPDADFNLARLCVTYLSYDSFISGYCRTVEELDCRLRLYAFYQYAAQNWGHHSRRASTLNEEIIHFLRCEKKVEAASQSCFGPYFGCFNLGYPQCVPPRVTGLHLIAHFGIAAQSLVNGLAIDPKDSQNRTPLLWAVINGHKDVVELFLKNGASVHIADEDGWTPLLAAVSKGHEDVVSQFINKGAVIDVANNEGKTPLWLAASEGYAEIVKLLLTGGATVDLFYNHWTPLLGAASKGYENIARLLLERGASVNTADWDEGRTPLIWAASGGHQEMARLLLEWGALVDMADRDRRTPLMYAAKRGHKGIVELLLQNGSKVNATDQVGLTALALAALEGHAGTIKLLLEHGAASDLPEDQVWATPFLFTSDRQQDIIGSVMERADIWKRHASSMRGPRSSVTSLSRGASIFVRMLGDNRSTDGPSY